MRRSLTFLTAPLWERARRQAERGRHAAAASEYQVLCDLDPHDVRASLKLAHHLVAAGCHERAAEEYLRAAVLYVGLDHPRRAMTVAMRALRLAPDRVVSERLAPLVAGLGPAAAELCEQVWRIHVLSGRRAQGRAVLGLLVRSEPESLPRRLRLAELELAEGRHAEAIAELRLVADGLRGQGRTAELVRVLEMMHAHGGTDEAVLRELATAYLRWGRPRRARAKLEALLRLVPDDRVTVERLARVYASQGLLSQTLRLLERLSALIEAQADRGELRAMLQRAASWCSDTSYQQALELLGLRALRPGGAVRLDPPVTRPLPRRRQHAAVPPPLPRALRRRPRVRSESGEIHVLDDLELLDEDDPTAGGPADGPSDGPTVETAPPPPTACAVAP